MKFFMFNNTIVDTSNIRLVYPCGKGVKIVFGQNLYEYVEFKNRKEAEEFIEKLKEQILEDV